MNETALRLWRAHRQKILYLIVGGWNTLVQYGVFSLCWYLLHDRLHPVLVLLISFVIASINGFLTFRHFVFGSARRPLSEYLRYQVVYGPLFGLNLLVLPLVLSLTDLNAYVIQALFSVFAVVAGYLGNKYFTFRPGRSAAETTGVD
jgi:putative flippase GtrA